MRSLALLLALAAIAMCESARFTMPTAQFRCHEEFEEKEGHLTEGPNGSIMFFPDGLSAGYKIRLICEMVEWLVKCFNDDEGPSKVDVERNVKRFENLKAEIEKLKGDVPHRKKEMCNRLLEDMDKTIEELKIFNFFRNLKAKIERLKGGVLHEKKEMCNRLLKNMGRAIGELERDEVEKCVRYLKAEVERLMNDKSFKNQEICAMFFTGMCRLLYELERPVSCFWANRKATFLCGVAVVAAVIIMPITLCVKARRNSATL